jgi:Restriction endonuclease
MTALNFKEIPSPQAGPGRDQFELFAREFLVLKGFKVVDGPDRGPDNGRDIILEETRSGPGGNTTVRWLVSCKHKAHGGGSVTPSDEGNIRDRLETHKCTGFIGFYSTLPSSGLSANLNALVPKFGLLVYDPASIERELLGAPPGRTLAARFMPVSFNSWVQNSQFAVAAPSVDPHLVRNKFFLREPHTKLDEGLEEARARGLLAFVVIYDQAHPLRSKLDFSLGCFMEYQTTKRHVDEHFVPVVGTNGDPLFSRLVPEDDPLELCLWVVLDRNGNVLRREGVYANPDEGLKRVREVIAAHGN